MRGIGPLLPARLEQAVRGKALQQRVQRRLLQSRVRDLRPELRQHRVIEPGIIQGQAEQVLPVQPGPDLLGGHPVGQVLRPLQHRDQRQPRRDQPGRPRIPNAPANTASCSHSPSRSRTITASGGSVFRDPYIARIAAATTGPGSGHGTGCIDMTRLFCSRDGGRAAAAARIMASITARVDHIARRGASRISHQGPQRTQNG